MIDNYLRNAEKMYEKEISKRMKFALHAAYQKGLVVKRNAMTIGWTIVLPSGRVFNARNLDEMTQYVDEY